MNEIEIELSEVNPQDFFGEQNKTITQLRTYFPKLKIIARGNKIKALGEEEILEEFEKRVDMLVAHFGKFNSLDMTTIELILSSDGSKDYEVTNKKDAFILHGIGGRIINAKTLNQQKLVMLSKKNDMLFAIGPAGTGKTYTSVALAVKALKEKQVKRIILTRPAVEAGENLGFLPGDMKEKLDPCLLYTSPSPRDQRGSRMPSSA